MKEMFKNKENLIFIVLLVLTALVLYYIPIVKSLFFLILLYLFFNSKNNYFWLAYFFTVIMDVGGFFKNLTDNIIEVGPISISLLFLFSIVSFAKVKRNKIRVPFFLKRNIDIWIFYLFVLIYIGFLIIGNSGGGKSGYRYYFFLLMMLPTILFLYTTYKFIPNEIALLNFSKLIFFTVILNIIGQFIHLNLGYPVYFFFEESKSIYEANIIEKDFEVKLIRPVWGAANMLLAFFLAMYWNVKKNHNFKNIYLLFIISLSIFSIFITATRGWIIAILILLFSTLYFINLKTKLQILKIILFLSLSYFFMYSISETVRIQTNKVVERVSTLKDLAKGDLTAGGTNSRLTDRNKPVMELFYKRPIFGNGFSLEGMKTNDQHVGNQNILMSGGIIGFFILIFLWGHIIRTSLRVHRQNLLNKNYNGETLLIIPFFLSLFIIHSSSMSIFGYIAYIKHPGKLLFLGVIFAIINQIVNNYKIKNS